MSPVWRPTVVLGSTVLVTGTLLVLAVAVRRPDLVVLAAPFVVCLAVALARRPATTSPELELHVPAEAAWEGDVPVVRLAVQPASGVQVVQIGVQHATGLQALGPGTLVCLVPGQDIEIPFLASRWGHKPIGPLSTVLVAGHGLLAARGRSHPGGSIAVLPSRQLFTAGSAAPVGGGFVGVHRSARAGDGTDIAQIRPFQPGDRLRRISWPASARTGRIHVTATLQDLDIEVYLVIDSGAEVGRDSLEGGSSLDVTVRAAAAVADHYLRTGDRVGLLDLGSRRRMTPARPGARHLRRLLGALLDVAPDLVAVDEAPVHDPRLRTIPTRALVIVFSALLDERIERQLSTLARRGDPTLVIDTLPPAAYPQTRQESTSLAWRLALLRRDTLRSRLADHGIPVVAWRGAGSLDHVLLRLARSAAMPRPRP
jgi:uncharacterized protein (DUF58 family)